MSYAKVGKFAKRHGSEKDKFNEHSVPETLSDSALCDGCMFLSRGDKCALKFTSPVRCASKSEVE
jgi:hypothetical protein